MSDPLPCHEDRQLHVILDLAHLERRRVAMPHEIIDEPLILADLAGTAAIGDASRLYDRRIVAHIIDDTNKAVIKYLSLFVKDVFERWHRGAPRWAGLTALAHDLVPLF